MTTPRLKNFVASKVATYKQVRIMEFVKEIPKSASGKTLRRVRRRARLQ